jgi:murein L,D-transpeptidase YafK
MIWRSRRKLGFRAVLIVAVLWVACWQAPGPPTNYRIVIHKTAHTLELVQDGKVVVTYKVAIGTGGLDPKQQQGDHLTPEGVYRVDAKNEHSRFYKAFHLSYPDAEDTARARKRGVSPGGDVEIHGLPWEFKYMGATQHLVDWTDGCIALSDDEIDQLWSKVQVGTVVGIEH